MDPSLVQKEEQEDVLEELLRYLDRYLTEETTQQGNTSSMSTTPPVTTSGATSTSRFRPTARTDTEIADIAANVRGEDRANLSTAEREKLHVAAIASLPTKFGLLSMSDEGAQLQNTYNVTMRILPSAQRYKL
jgi:hypothetical protein